MARTERHKIHNREAVADMPDWMKEKNCPHKKKYMAGKRIQPKNLTGKEKLTYIVDECFLAYNSARLKEACQLFTNNMLDADVTVGMSISGALTPAGLGCSSIIPLIKAGFYRSTCRASIAVAARQAMRDRPDAASRGAGGGEAHGRKMARADLR